MTGGNIGGNFKDNGSDSNKNQDKPKIIPKDKPNDNPKDKQINRRHKKHIISPELYENPPLLVKCSIKKEKMDTLNKDLKDRPDDNKNEKLRDDSKKENYNGYVISDELYETPPVILKESSIEKQLKTSPNDKSDNNKIIFLKSNKRINWNLHIGSIQALNSLSGNEKVVYKGKMLPNAAKIYEYITMDVKKKKKGKGDKVDDEYFPKHSDLREFGYRSFENAICDRKISLEKIRKHLKMSFENMIDILKSGEQMNWNIQIGKINKLDSLSGNEKKSIRK